MLGLVRSRPWGGLANAFAELEWPKRVDIGLPRHNSMTAPDAR
jgi:hypothetical protein